MGQGREGHRFRFPAALSRLHVRQEKNKQKRIVTVCRVIRRHKFKYALHWTNMALSVTFFLAILLWRQQSQTRCWHNLIMSSSVITAASVYFQDERLQEVVIDRFAVLESLRSLRRYATTMREGVILTSCQEDELQEMGSHFRANKLDCLLALWLMS